MKKPANYPFHTIWSGALNLGDTPGVFQDSSFVGLLLQIPISITFLPEDEEFVELMLVTDEVEIFNQKVHYVYFDWIVGSALSKPIGQIDDIDIVPDLPEFHLLKIETKNLQLGNHTITIVVNTEVPQGLKDDFVLRRIDASNHIGARIGF